MAEDITEGNNNTQQSNQQAEVNEPLMVPVEKLQRMEKAHKTLQGKLAELEKLAERYQGIDPDEARAWKVSLEEKEKELAKANPEKLEEMLKNKFDKERRELSEKLTSFEKAIAEKDQIIKGYRVTDKVMAELGNRLNEGKSRKFIRAEIEARADLDEDGNIYFKDEDGEPMYSKVNRGQLLTAKEFGDLLEADYPEFFKPVGSSGSANATPGQKTNGYKGKLPETYAELMARPDGGKIWNSLSVEDKQRIGKTAILKF